jgi:energy-coupling factor transporter ATP-binding protein EcfA2
MVAAALARLAAGGASILVAEQKTDLLAGICSRVVVLDAGRLVLDGPAAEILADARLTDLGVAPPAAVRLRRAAQAAQLPAATLTRLDEALAGTPSP